MTDIFVSRTDFQDTEYGWPPENQGQTSVNLDITCPQKLQTSTNQPPGQPPLAPLFLFSLGVFHSPKCSEAGCGHRDTGGEKHENRLQFLARKGKLLHVIQQEVSL